MTKEEFLKKMNDLSDNQKDFAKKLKVSNGLVAGMISGQHNISPKTLQKIKDLEEGKPVVQHYDNEPKKEKKNKTIWTLTSKSFEITGTKESIMHFLKGE